MLRPFAIPVAISLAVALGLCGPHAGAAEARETWFDWSAERCAKWDIPDTPVRIWREASGFALVAGSEASRASRGPGPGALRRDCAVLHAGSQDPDPEALDDRAWIAATWAHEDGRIEALAHVEFHGEKHGRCAAGRTLPCWRNAVVALESRDRGRSFRRVPGPPVAALPYPYDGTQTRRSGYFNPSNIFRRGDHLHAFVFAEAAGAQRRGACLLRRPVDGAPADWRAWDGIGFGARLSGLAGPARGDTCVPVEGVTSTLSSVVADTAGGFLAVTPAVLEGRSGFWLLRSDDLLRWSDPELLVALPLLWRRDCAAPAAYAYPALVDLESPARNLDTTDGALWLAATRMPLDAACRVGPERDLVAWRMTRGADGRFVLD